MGMRRYWMIGAFLCCAPETLGQILQTDTLSDARYGNQTTRFFTIDDLYWATGRTYALDSLMWKEAPQTALRLNNFQFAHLGTLGTSARALYYRPPTSPAATTGWESQYELFFPSSQKTRFFDTKGPFLSAYVLFGGRRRTNLSIRFARNIHQRLGFSFTFQSLSSEQSIGWNQSTNNQQVRAPGVQANTYYFSKDSTYHVSFAVATLRRRIWENGGFKPDNNQTLQDFFVSPAPQRHLNHAIAEQHQYDIHLLNRLRIAPTHYVYMAYYGARATHTFTDDLATDDSLFYEQFHLSKTRTDNALRFDTHALDVGWLRKTERINYRVYGRYRRLHYSDHRPADTPFSSVAEYALGAEARLHTGRHQWQLAALALHSGHYQLHLQWKTPYIGALWQVNKYKTPWLLQYYQGNHYQWNHSQGLAAQSAHYLRINGYLGGKKWHLNPFTSLTRRTHAVFFDGQQVVQLQRPQCLSKANQHQYLSQSGVALYITFLKKLSLRSHWWHTYAFGLRPSIWSTPPWVLQSALQFQDEWFQRHLHITLGLQSYTRTAYYAMDYAPAIQQFYPQHDIQLGAYTRLDAFVQVKINQFSLNLRIHHLNQQRGNGYWMSPSYPALNRLFDLRILYFFFD